MSACCVEHQGSRLTSRFVHCLAYLRVTRIDSIYTPYIGQERRRRVPSGTDLLRSLRWLADDRNFKASSLSRESDTRLCQEGWRGHWPYCVLWAAGPLHVWFVAVRAGASPSSVDHCLISLPVWGGKFQKRGQDLDNSPRRSRWKPLNGHRGSWKPARSSGQVASSSRT